jgi:hypothetical protein
MGRFAGHFDHLLPQEAEQAAERAAMHILIDTTNGRALARHDSYKALAALHYIQFANVDGAIVRCGENKAYAQFSQDQLAMMLWNCGVRELPKKLEYSDLVKLVRNTLETAEWLLLPFPLHRLEQQAHAIPVNDARPMAFDPQGDRPTLLSAWHSEPQANRSRADSSFWVHFAAGQSVADGLIDASSTATVRMRVPAHKPSHPTEETPMAASKSAKKAAKKVAKKTAPAKKGAAKKAAPAKRTTGNEQEERNGVKRPRPGGNTAQVWDVCDALFAKAKTCPSFKDVDEAIEKKNADIPTATRRSNYAVWRKFHGITGRVS